MLTALAGLAGIVLGGLLQLFSARMNTMQEQRRTYEARKYEKRSELYLRMLAYVDHMERVAGRGYNYTYDVKVPKKESVKHATRDLRALAVELKVYGSPATDLAFVRWSWHYAEHRAIMANDEALIAIREAHALSGQLLAQSKFILELANGRAEKTADKLAEQVQSELIGKDSRSVVVRIRRFRYDRISKQISDELDACIKTEAEKLYQAFSEAKEKKSVSEPSPALEASSGAVGQPLQTDTSN